MNPTEKKCLKVVNNYVNTINLLLNAFKSIHRHPSYLNNFYYMRILYLRYSPFSCLTDNVNKVFMHETNPPAFGCNLYENHISAHWIPQLNMTKRNGLWKNRRAPSTNKSNSCIRGPLSSGLTRHLSARNHMEYLVGQIIRADLTYQPNQSPHHRPKHW